MELFAGQDKNERTINTPGLKEIPKDTAEGYSSEKQNGESC